MRLARALPLRACPQDTRAFAANADFGFIRCEENVDALWFAAAALSEAPSRADALDASFPDGAPRADTLLVVSARSLAPKRPATTPLVTEAELDALFERVEECRRVVLDDLGDEARWVEPYWSDVDSYLAHVAETMDPAALDTPHMLGDFDLEIHDLDIRDASPSPDPQPDEAATHFWLAGDDDDLAIAGQGQDLFIVNAGEDAATVLIEDGASWSMRTGGSARLDEIVVSLSRDAWRDVDAMTWRRIATLSGIAEVRVEQNACATQRVVVAGVLPDAGLGRACVRLVRSGEDGVEEFPVTCIMADAADAFAA